MNSLLDDLTNLALEDEEEILDKPSNILSSPDLMEKTLPKTAKPSSLLDDLTDIALEETQEETPENPVKYRKE